MRERNAGNYVVALESQHKQTKSTVSILQYGAILCSDHHTQVQIAGMSLNENNLTENKILQGKKTEKEKISASHKT